MRDIDTMMAEGRKKSRKAPAKKAKPTRTCTYCGRRAKTGFEKSIYRPGKWCCGGTKPAFACLKRMTQR